MQLRCVIHCCRHGADCWIPDLRTIKPSSRNLTAKQALEASTGCSRSLQSCNSLNFTPQSKHVSPHDPHCHILAAASASRWVQAAAVPRTSHKSASAMVLRLALSQHNVLNACSLFTALALCSRALRFHTRSACRRNCEDFTGQERHVGRSTSRTEQPRENDGKQEG